MIKFQAVDIITYDIIAVYWWAGHNFAHTNWKWNHGPDGFTIAVIAFAIAIMRAANIPIDTLVCVKRPAILPKISMWYGMNSIGDVNLVRLICRVVTGIRFLKKNRIIHIFISERKLGANGKIEESTLNDEPWLSDYNFLKEDSSVKEGIDYHELTWKNRIIELDTIRAPKDEVVTGVRFRVVGDRRLRFEIRNFYFNALKHIFHEHFVICNKSRTEYS